MMRINEAQLTAYLDGELSPAEHTQLEKQIANSPELQAKLVQLRQEINQVNGALTLLAPALAAEKTPAFVVKHLPRPALTRNSASSGNRPPWLKRDTSSLPGMLKNGLLFLKISSVAATVITLMVGIGLYAEFLRPWLARPAVTTELGSQPTASPAYPTVQTTATITFTPQANIAATDKIIFTAGNPQSGYIYGLNHEGSNWQLARRLTDTNNIVLSPDGQRLAMAKADGDIYVMNLDGANLINLTNSPDKYEQYPAWSPDGQKIAFETLVNNMANNGHSTIQMININGANRVNLDSWPVWSPDGKRMAFTRADGQSDIVVMNTDGTNVMRLTHRLGVGAMWGPGSGLAWSPDGQQIAYVDAGMVYTLDVDSGHRFLVTAPLPGYSELSGDVTWSPDGQKLAFRGVKDDDRKTYLFTVNPDGSERKLLTGINNYTTNYAWSPDGKEIVFAADKYIYVMQADGTRFTRLTEDTFDNLDYLQWWSPQRQPMMTKMPKPSTSPSAATANVKSALTFDYGLQVDPMGDVDANIAHLKKLGFKWVKLQMPWADVQTIPYFWKWAPFDELIKKYAQNDIKVMLSITKAPHWARPEDDDFNVSGLPADPADYADFATVAARYYRGKVQAIEVWSEPNLWNEAGGQGRMNAARYVELLQRTYQAVKLANPDMIVVSAGLAPNGNNNDLAIDDVEYLKQMYAAGARGYFDALGAHPLGYNCPAMADWRTVTPKEAAANPNQGLFTNRHHSWCFLGTMAAYREVMVTQGDAATPIIITEFGWPVSAQPAPGFEFAQDNTPEEQAQWIVEAYQWGAKQPWVGPMILWNLDYGVTSPASQFASYGIIDTPAYQALLELNHKQ